jgi:hypothetical protein
MIGVELLGELLLGYRGMEAVSVGYKTIHGGDTGRNSLADHTLDLLL